MKKNLVKIRGEKMSNILIVCQTPYQIIVASKIVESFYSKDQVDIIITNNINGGEELVKRVKISTLYRNVFYLKTRRLQFLNQIDPFINYTNKKYQILKQLKVTIKKNKYDKLLFCNIDVLVQHIASLSSKYAPIELIMFEDGLSSYRKKFGDIFNNYIQNKNIKGILNYSLLRSHFSRINKFYVFNPTYLEWKPSFSVVKIPNISKKDERLISELNKIFIYEDSKEEYDFKYIFFEESYFADGYKVNDLELINEIANNVGKDNILVKIHPRNHINRFKELGYHTNKITSVPWEIIALNMKLEDKVLITIASGSVMHPTIIMNEEIRAIMLFSLKELDTQLMEDLIDIIKSICQKNNERYFIPRNYEELNSFLKLMDIE